MTQPVAPLSYHDALAHFRAEAAAVPADQLQICRADPRVVLVNLKLGIKSTLATEEQIAFVQEHLSKIALKPLLDLPNLGRALIMAVSDVVRHAASPGDIQAKIDFIRDPREQLLSLAEVLAQRGKLDKDKVAKVRAGSGKYDMAHDVVILVGMFRESAAKLAGLHPFSDEELGKYLSAGEWLMENITPDGARVEERKKTEAEHTRDQLWTLIVERHAALRKIGFYLHGEEIDRHVPKLLSRVSAAEIAEEAAPPAAPVAPPAG